VADQHGIDLPGRRRLQQGIADPSSLRMRSSTSVLFHR
jgi:hypothetical protein